MKKIVTTLLIFASLIAMHSVYAKPKLDAGTVSFAQTLPDFSLQDPAGKTFTKDGLFKDGMVLVVTSPILKNKGAQEGWDKYLSKARSGSNAKWVYLEDLQPSLFKDMAISGMKKGYESGKEPILLIDKNGNIRRELKVAAKRTVVLVYDSDGKLVHSETGKPSSKAADEIWGKVKDSKH